MASLVLRPARRRPALRRHVTQLVASLGTPYAFDPPDGCVLFLEDVNERPYRIDRMLTQLRLSGVLGRARRSCSARCAAATSRAATSTARDVIASPDARLSRARCCSDFRRATPPDPAGRCRWACDVRVDDHARVRHRDRGAAVE